MNNKNIALVLGSLFNAASKKMTAAIVAICLLAVGSVANAASWYTFSDVVNDYKMYFFDANSVEKKEGNVTLWVKYVNNDQPDNDGSYSTATKLVFSCAAKTYQELNSSIYDKDRKFMRSYPTPGNVNQLQPNTLVGVMQEVICMPNFPKDTSGKYYFPVKDNDIYSHAARYYENQKARKVDSAPQ